MRSLSPLAAAFDALVASPTQSPVGLFRTALSARLPPASPAAAAAASAAAAHIVALVDADAHTGRSPVKRLDALSDILCAVVDTAELIRNVHPSQQNAVAAHEAHAVISSLLSRLNTHRPLHSALAAALANTDSRHMPTQERSVATALLADFEKSGIHMPAHARSRFVALNDRILALGQKFTANAVPATPSIRFSNPSSDLAGLPLSIIQAIASSHDASIPTSSDIASLALRCAHNHETRRKIFIATNSASQDQLATLSDLLAARAQLASLLGKQSYAHLFLSDKMAKSPETVWSFLDSLAAANRPLADTECARLASIKRIHTGKSDPIQAWDRLYYAQFLSAHPSNSSLSASAAAAASDPLHSIRHTAAISSSGSSDAIAAYFSLGTVMEGLSMVFNALYGIRFEPSEIAPGETWHADVRKINVVHETEGKLGTIYCDLFQREPGAARKYDNAAHFTVRCSRRIDDDHLIWSTTDPDLAVQSESMADLARAVLDIPDNERDVVVDADGNPIPGAVPGTDPNQRIFRYQLPIVVLVTSFPRPAHPDKPALLSLHDIDTLFHEMGHAMHSMIARTDFQHIAGTRVSMDFVEVPSILMEYFARSPHVLAAFGRHYKTGEPVPIDLLWSLRSSLSSFEALETQRQLQMAMLDQLYHSPTIAEQVNDAAASQSNQKTSQSSGNGRTRQRLMSQHHASSNALIDTTSILSDLQNRVFPIPHVPGTHWQAHFTHLFTYGASYYTYFWSRRWANRIYRQLFADKPMHAWREGGDQLRHSVLKHGGGIDPWEGLERISGVVRDDERKENPRVVIGELADLS